MQKLFILAYVSSLISVLVFLAASAEALDNWNAGGKSEDKQLFEIFGKTMAVPVMITALIFPFVFYYYVTWPVLSQGWKKLGQIRNKQGHMANYFAVLGSFLGALVPMNSFSRNQLVALVN